MVSNIGHIRNTRTNKILSARLSGSGYLQALLYKNGKPKNHLIHRLIAEAFIENPDNKPYVDHINNVKTDNRLVNLRWATLSENNRNRNKRQNTLSQYIGVTKRKNGKYQTYIRINKQNIYLGAFDNEIDAAKAYNNAAIIHFGLYAKLNILPE